MKTKLLSRSEYPTNFLTAQDLIKQAVDKEAYRIINEKPKKLCYYCSKPKLQINGMFIVNNIIKFIKSLLP